MKKTFKKLMTPSEIVYRATDHATKENVEKLKEMYPSQSDFQEEIILKNIKGFLKTNLFPYFYSKYGNQTENKETQDALTFMMDTGIMKSVNIDTYNKEKDTMERKRLPFIPFQVLDTPNFTSHLSVLPEYSSEAVEVFTYIEFQNEFDVFTRIVLKQSVKGNVRSFVATMKMDDVLDGILSTQPSTDKGFLPFGYKIDEKGELSFVQFDPTTLQQDQIFLDVYSTESLKEILGEMVSKVSFLAE